MPIDFNNIQTTRGREYDANMISRLNDSLQTVPIKQRAAILGSVIEESGGNPLAKSASNAYQGLLQWGKDRYRITSNDKEREFTKQIELIRKTLNDSTDHISWSHGGEGSGYKSFKEPLHIFHNPELPFEDVYRAFSYGYVRPKGKEESYSNRLKVAQQVYDRLNTQSNPTVTKQDIVDAVMAIPTAIAEGMDKVVTFGKSMFPQTSQKGSPNKSDNTMRWAEGGFLYQPKDAWDTLSMKDKAAMMEVAVRNGITSLKDIKEKYNEFAEGGKIHIKDSKKGTFTAAASRHNMGVQEFASKVLANKDDYSPAMVKKANFARNARKWHGEGGTLQGPIVNIAMANMYEDGGEEVTAFTPIKKPIIPVVEGDQEAVQWLANWYNNRRKQMYDNLKDYDGRQTFLYDLKDRLTGNPIGRRAINHDYYNKLNNIARYKTATFDDLERDNTASFDMLSGNAFGIIVPETGKIYYDDNRMEEATSLQNKQEGYSPLGVHIHERTHSSGMTGDDGKFTGYNVQTKALEDILRLKDGVEYDEYLDAMPEVYGRMMEFRYNHNLNPKKKYNKQEIKKLLDKENKGYKSELQRYDLNTLTKALNDVADAGFTNPFSPLYS